MRQTGVRIWYLSDYFSAIVHGEEICFVVHAIWAFFDVDAFLRADGVGRNICKFVHVEAHFPFGHILVFITYESATRETEEMPIDVPVSDTSVFSLWIWRI